MEKSLYIKNLQVPKGKIDVVMDTDAYNEIDDQFALAYLLKSTEKLNTVAIYAAPFFNHRSKSPADGMQKSYDEILKLLKLMGKEELEGITFKGSENYLKDENTPVISPAVTDLINRAKNYSPENPLYVVAIGAITNIASALIAAPEIAENIVIVWLGGHCHNHKDTAEFNMVQDIAAARVVFKSQAPLVQLPCVGVVSSFYFSLAELEQYLKGKNELCDFLFENMVQYKNEVEIKADFDNKVYSKVIWDVTAVAWLLNDNDCFMQSNIVAAPMPEYDKTYSPNADSNRLINYVYYISRDALATDLINKVIKE